MHLPRSFAALAALPILLSVAPRARADVPPPNACTTVGQACNSAQGPNGYTAAGTCVSATCPHAGPLADGAIGTTEEPCELCVSDGGTPSSSGSTTDGSASSSGGGSSSSSGGGCAVGAVRAERLAPFALMAAGAAIVAVSRRRRNRR